MILGHANCQLPQFEAREDDLTSANQYEGLVHETRAFDSEGAETTTSIINETELARPLSDRISVSK